MQIVYASGLSQNVKKKEKQFYEINDESLLRTI